ncbi:MAG: NnrS family protein, partial [Arcobacter sp.]|nr:NnrS family protein [Arcobacter sp.]
MKRTYRFKILNKYFFSQPHQPFFVFGIFWSLLSIFVFALSHNGIISLLIPENLFHTYSLIFITFSHFFYGFLFTTFPRFCSSLTIPKAGYIRMISFYQIGAIIFFMGSLISWKLTLLGMIFIFLSNILSVFALYLVYKNGSSPVKQDPFWLLIAQYLGAGSNLAIMVWYFLYNIEIIFNPMLINLIAFYLYIIFTAFVVGQRMI